MNMTIHVCMHREKEREKETSVSNSCFLAHLHTGYGNGESYAEWIEPAARRLRVCF